MKILVASWVALAATALASPCFAQRVSTAPTPAAQPAQQPAAQPAQQPAAQPAQQPAHPDAEPAYSVTTVNGHRVYVLVNNDPIYGEVQRPYAFAVSGRSALGYTALEATRSFVPDVNAAVRRDPF
ncbi:MAG: hypothetical protein U0326_04170 [Polyangiales bacterium]